MSRRADHRRDMILLYTLLAVIIFLLVFPLVYTVGGSSKSAEELLLGDLKIFPETWRSENYMKAWKQANFARYTLNNMFFVVASVTGITIISSMTEYAMSRRDSPGKKLLTGTSGLMMFLVGAVTLFPIFQLCHKLGLLGSAWGMVIIQITTAQPFYCILVMGYYSGISKEVDEAATIDGASLLKVYTTVLMPIMRLTPATTDILAFRDTWSNYMMPPVFTLSHSELRPLTMSVVPLKDQGDGVVAQNTMLAGTVMSVVPVLIIYLFLNWYFVEGITAGTIKG